LILLAAGNNLLRIRGRIFLKKKTYCRKHENSNNSTHKQTHHTHIKINIHEVEMRLSTSQIFSIYFNQQIINNAKMIFDSYGILSQILLAKKLIVHNTQTQTH
ncbi:hypothetical protein BLA29_002415, partial [Euroglyphus maynei]